MVFLSNLSAAFNREDLRANVLVDAQLGIGCSALDRENRCRYPTLAKRAIAQRIQEENTSEELRVLYVAMTRTKDMLIMTYASRYLTRRLETIAQQVTLGSNPALSQEADCLGHWVLMAAMVRTEAGELFAQAGQPEERVVSEHPWRIRFHQRGPEQSAPIQETQPPAGEPEQLPDVEPLLSFRYPYQAAVDAPSKVTATQLKGRELDREAAEQAVQPLSAGARRWRQPALPDPAPPGWAGNWHGHPFGHAVSSLRGLRKPGGSGGRAGSSSGRGVPECPPGPGGEPPVDWRLFPDGAGTAVARGPGGVAGV